MNSARNELRLRENSARCELSHWENSAHTTPADSHTGLTSLHLTILSVTLWEKFTNRGCYSAKDIIRLLSDIANLNVCAGNPDEGFINDFPCKSEVAYIDIYQYSDNDGISREKTVRVKTCKLLTVNKRIGCIKYRGSLRKRHSSLGSGDTRKNTGNNTENNSKCHRYMLNVELIHKVDALNVKEKKHEENHSLKDYVQKLLLHGHDLCKSDIEGLSELVADCADHIKQHFPDENSFQRSFIEQLMKYSKMKDKRGMRWHPTIIKWCLYIKSKSTKAYEAMRDSGFINLPNSPTLFDYSHFTRSKCGLSVDVIKHLQAEARAKGLFNDDLPRKRYVGLLQDEIKVKEDLVYDRHTGELVGYIDLDKAGELLLFFTYSWWQG